MPRKHVLKFMIEKCKAYTLELAKVFPLDTEEEKHLFELLERSYIEARYNDKFVVPKEVVDALVPKVDLLFNIVEDVCRKQFDYYKQQSRNKAREAAANPVIRKNRINSGTRISPQKPNL